jgi:hypothetical protein
MDFILMGRRNCTCPGASSSDTMAPQFPPNLKCLCTHQDDSWEAARISAPSATRI